MQIKRLRLLKLMQAATAAFKPLAVGVCCVAAAGGVFAQPANMPGVDPEFTALIERCAPTVHPETMAAVVSAESRGHRFAIADAGPVKLPWAQRKHLVRSHYLGTLDSAVAKAEELIANGHTVSLGFAQINDRNLPRLGLSVRDVFDPCVNIAAGGKILTEFYQKASKQFGAGTVALRAAISAYNSGNWVRGEKDGYVDLVYKQVGRPLSMKAAPVVPRLRQAATKELTAKSITIGAQRGFTMTANDFVVSER